jgi:hypothetical protein
MINIDIVYPIRNLILPNVWMEGDKGKVEERGGEDDRDILKVSTFHELLSSPLLPFLSVPNIPLVV